MRERTQTTHVSALARRLLFGGVALLLTTPSLAHAIVGGAAQLDNRFAFVVRVDSAAHSCSGILVHEQWILTLKSCFGQVSQVPGPPPTYATATFGATQQIALIKLSAHPTQDLVLARLASPATGVTPVRFGSAPALGEELLAAGFGRTESEWTPDLLHTTLVIADGVTQGNIAFASTVTCQGDAGGPTLRERDGQLELVGVHDGSRQAGCLAATSGAEGSSDLRADKLGAWLEQHVSSPLAVDEMSRNLARDAVFSASTSAENWGWYLATINDGRRDVAGWSSWRWETDVPLHTEWIEFAFPNGEARRVNRVDLYPRLDLPPGGNNFPRDLSIEVWNGSAWETVLSRTNYPATGAEGAKLTFPVHTTNKIRVQGMNLTFMQFFEVEAYLSTNLAADATVTASSSAENWGWFLRNANDGQRDVNGWSSWSWESVVPPHTEWIELSFPEAQERRIDRVDIYPRVDIGPGSNFPANFTLDVWTGSGWESVVSETNYAPPGRGGAKFIFPERSTSKIRFQGTGVTIMQLDEIEIYHSANIAADASIAASSSAENWGWFMIDATDQLRDTPGWTSWADQSVDHAEWIELTFPKDVQRPVNRVDIYPRIDLPEGNNFPSNFTIDTWNGSAWETVVSETGYPKPDASGAHFAFPVRTTNKLRFRGTDLRIMQLNEIEAFYLASETIPAPLDPLPAIVEQGDYPGADAIYERWGIRLKKGDGRISFVECGSEPAPDMIAIETLAVSLPEFVCFRAKGLSGYLTLELPSAFLLHGDDRHTLAVTVQTADRQGGDPVVEVERVEPYGLRPVGYGQLRGDATVLELRFPYRRP